MRDRETRLTHAPAGLSYLSKGGDRSAPQLDKACGIGVVIPFTDIFTLLTSCSF